MTFSQIGDALLAGGRVTLLMRHAERPPLDPSDVTFGATLPITPYGRETAQRFGAVLSRIVSPRQVYLFASTTVRTIQTAECILRGLNGGVGETDGAVGIVPELGSDSPYFGSLDERMALIAGRRYRERLNDYFRIGEQRGYRPLKTATTQMDAALRQLETPDCGLTIAVTHDVNVASFLAGHGVVTDFDEELWPHYLDAAVVVRLRNGNSECAYFRHDLSLG